MLAKNWQDLLLNAFKKIIGKNVVAPKICTYISFIWMRYLFSWQRFPMVQNLHRFHKRRTCITVFRNSRLSQRSFFWFMAIFSFRKFLKSQRTTSTSMSAERLKVILLSITNMNIFLKHRCAERIHCGQIHIRRVVRLRSAGTWAAAALQRSDSTKWTWSAFYALNHSNVI